MEGRSVMAAKKFGYVRVSTREQNLDRQIHILRDEEGIDERDIYVEKEPGRQFERPVYRFLVDNILREGDLLVVTELVGQLITDVVLAVFAGHGKVPGLF